MPTKKKANPQKAGAKTTFRDEYCDQVRKLGRLVRTLTDKDIALFFDKTEQTINSWKKNHPEFLESLKDGKRYSDMEVADKVYQRACGFKYVEQQAIKVKEVQYGDNGKKISEVEKVVVVEVNKMTPPDTTACMFWLTNREKEHWRNKTAQEVTGKDGGPIEHKEVPTAQKDHLSELSGVYAKGLEAANKPAKSKLH